MLQRLHILFDLVILHADTAHSSSVALGVSPEINHADFIVEISAALIFLLSCLFLMILRLYRMNLAKTKRLLAESAELEAEVLNNKALTNLLHNIFESSLNGIIAFESVRDDNGNIIDFTYQMVNERAANLVGRDIPDLVGESLLNVHPGNKDSGLFDAYKNTVLTGKPFHTVIHYVHENIDKWFQINSVKNADGFIVTFSDISEFKLNEKLLIKKQMELEEANYELEQFAYIASHDLKEPLRKIRAFGDRLESGYHNTSDEKALDYIFRMRSASDRMQSLIDDLLKFSRASRGDIEKQQVDLNEVMAEVVETLSETIEQTSAQIHSQALPTIVANQQQMTQVFQNIIANALKYSEENKEPQITIGVSKVELMIEMESKTFWQIDITDNGIGFENAYNEKIFEIFQRLHGRSQFSGTGIGLAICKKIIVNHQGFIFAHGEPGKGATFTLQLPC